MMIVIYSLYLNDNDKFCIVVVHMNGYNTSCTF